MRKLRDSLFIWLIEHDMVFLLKLYSDLIRVVTFPIRLFRLKDYIKQRQYEAREFEVGEWVRLKKLPNDAPVVLIGPKAQNHFDETTLGEKMHGGRVLKQRPHGKGGANHSFFDAREPWRIKSIVRSSLEDDVWYYLRGIGICHRCTLTLENPEVVFGDKVIPQVPAQIVEKVLPNIVSTTEDN